MKHIHAQSLIVHRSNDPTLNDNASRGFAVESEWYNGTTFWKLTSFSGADAIWEHVGSSSPYKATITCDGVLETYTYSHGKNNDAPCGSIYVYDSVNLQWQPIDWNQGVIANDADSITVNLMNYLTGNTNGTIYKLTIIA